MTLSITSPLKKQINTKQELKIITDIPSNFLLNLTQYDTYLLRPQIDFHLTLDIITNYNPLINSIFTKILIIDSLNILNDSIIISFDKNIKWNSKIFSNISLFKNCLMFLTFTTYNLGSTWNGSVFGYYSYQDIDLFNIDDNIMSLNISPFEKTNISFNLSEDNFDLIYNPELSGYELILHGDWNINASDQFNSNQSNDYINLNSETSFNVKYKNSDLMVNNINLIPINE